MEGPTCESCPLRLNEFWTERRSSGDLNQLRATILWAAWPRGFPVLTYSLTRHNNTMCK